MKLEKLAGLLLAGTLVITGCSGDNSNQSAVASEPGSAAEASGQVADTGGDGGDTIKIGLIAMLTGNNPLNGLRMQQAVQLAVDEANENGGILGRKVELLVEDDQTLQDMAVTCANKLIGEGVVGIVGPHRSTNAMAIEQVINQKGVVTITGGTTPQITTLDNPYLFRCRASDAIFAKVAATYAVDKLGAKKVGMFYNNDEFGTGGEETARAYCKANNIEYISEGHNTNDKDFTGQIMKMKNAGVEAVLIWTHDPELAIHARQIKELGLDVPVVCSPGVTMPQVIDMCEAEQIEGWYGVTDFVSGSTSPATRQFAEVFESKYNVPAELFSASYYGGAVALLTAIEKAGTADRESVRNAMAELEGISVPIGIITCDENNDMMHEVSVARLENKVPVYVETIKVSQ
ncbi:ABC transporter substrate-binding protein [Lachnospiraceae bacterium 54-53]